MNARTVAQAKRNSEPQPELQGKGEDKEPIEGYEEDKGNIATRASEY
jgi:hypothetical protein